MRVWLRDGCQAGSSIRLAGQAVGGRGKSRRVRSAGSGLWSRWAGHEVEAARAAWRSLGGLAGGGGLGGVVLGFAEVGDGLDEADEPGQERELGQDGIAGRERGTGHEPGGVAQVVAERGWTGDAAVGHAGGAVVGVGGLAESPGCPARWPSTCRVSAAAQAASARGVRVGDGEVPDLLRGVSGGAGGVLVDGVAFG